MVINNIDLDLAEAMVGEEVEEDTLEDVYHHRTTTTIGHNVSCVVELVMWYGNATVDFIQIFRIQTK